MSPVSFQNLGREIGVLVETKNAAYGESFARSGEVMRVLYPNGIAPEQLDDALGVVRIIDKLFRIANRPDAFGESPFGDIAGYGLLGAARHRERQHERQPPTSDSKPPPDSSSWR